MINSSAVSDIKRAQKESQLLREISSMFHAITMDDSRLLGLFVNRVELSTDKGWCTIYFYTADGYEKYAEQFEVLKLYKPSMRKALSSEIKSRYVPNLKFEYDSKFEKQQRLELAMSLAAQDIKKHEGDE